MFISEKICTMVDLFNKAAADGERLSPWKGSQVTTRHRNIDR